MITDTIKEIRIKGLKQWLRDRKSAKHDDTNAWFDVITFDIENFRYRLDRTTIKEKDVPPDCLKVTGDKHHYAIVTCKQPLRVIRDEKGYLNTSAISNYLYLVNNAINDALASVSSSRYINWKLIGVLGIGAAIVVYIIVTRFLV